MPMIEQHFPPFIGKIHLNFLNQSQYLLLENLGDTNNILKQ
jgi:hypothetical protein